MDHNQKTEYPSGLNSQLMDYINKNEYPHGLNSHPIDYIQKLNIQMN